MDIESDKMSKTIEIHQPKDVTAREEKQQQSPQHPADDRLPTSFAQSRHVAPIQGNQAISKSWRIRDRMKTVSVALVVCLNVGVDPPDVFKITPCARLECWIDPSSVSSQKAMEMIGINLQKQYERWQPRARYKQSLDPTSEDIKKLCTSLRRSAKEERVLFHYNGHGVPRPTINGEIWVFNRVYTQYIPLSIYDLQSWIGAPSIYVYDCSSAGMIVNLFNQFAEQHEREMEQAPETTAGNAAAAAGKPANTSAGAEATAAPNASSFKSCIQLAACAANQILPMNPQLPADLFTSCLTTPIKTALKWFTLQQTSALVPNVSYALIERIPGLLNDRRTMLGELNWIFTAITDTIAWNILPRDLFQTLFRQDLLVASLFRNFLLADRIMRAYDCTPVSSPALPPCHRHPMWASWDLAVDLAVQQLPAILDHGATYQNSPFFEDQLSAFHVWLDQGCEERNPPEQLPIVLQVLLSQVHRLRALELLGRFLDLGPWAVNLALSVGIFPYVLKLLQASAKELRPILVFIWAKILAVDNTVQVDLVVDQGHKYFLSVLQDAKLSSDDRTLAAFVLANLVHGFPLGQLNTLQGSLVSICLVQLHDPSAQLRQWLAICLGHLWQNFDRARWSGVRDLAHEKLYPLLSDPVPEVRASAVYALGTFISSVTRSKDRTEHANNIDRSIAMTLLSTVGNDMSPIVRMEVIAAFQWMIILFENQFVSAFLQEPSAVTGLPAAVTQHSHSPYSSNYSGAHNSSSLERNINMKRVSSSSSIAANNTSFPTSTVIGFGSTYMKLWQGLIALARDPHPDVAQLAQLELDHVINQAVNLISAKEATKENFSSMSLPPSPNTRTNYMGESPPTHHHINMNTSLNSPSMFASANGHSKPSKTSTPAAARSRKNSRQHLTSTDETTDLETDPDKEVQKPIVTTNFIPWCVAQFSAPSPNYLRHKQSPSAGAAVSDQLNDPPTPTLVEPTVALPPVDPHAPQHLERLTRFARNDETRRVAREQQRRAIFNKLETQSWGGRTQYAPTLVKLHPFELQIAVAYKNKIMVNDWARSTIQSYVPSVPSTRTSTSSSHAANLGAAMDSDVAALEFVNSHDRTLILAGYDDGCLRIWRPPPPSDQQQGADAAQLVTAWQSMADITMNKFQQKFGLVMAWQQQSETIVVGGDAKVLRCWDARTERKVCDLATGSDAAVSVLHASPYSGYIAAGCRDGSVRLYDKRLPGGEARVRTYRETSGTVLAACLRDNGEHLVVGCSQKSVRIFDVRHNGSLLHWSSKCGDAASDQLLQMSVHTSADVIACGSNSISMYGIDGKALNVIRTGFIGKMGNVSCLAFHPLKVSLAVGFADSAVAVYVSDSRRIV